VYSRDTGRGNSREGTSVTERLVKLSRVKLIDSPGPESTKGPMSSTAAIVGARFARHYRRLRGHSKRPCTRAVLAAAPRLL
jgi:hypothetical protein